MYATYICIKEFPFTYTMVVENLCLLNSCNLFALKKIWRNNCKQHLSKDLALRMQFRQRRQQHLNNVFYTCILSKQQIMQFVFRKYLWSFCKHHTIFVKTKQTILVKWLRAQALDVFEGWVAWLRNFREDEESGIIAFQKQNVACCFAGRKLF